MDVILSPGSQAKASGLDSSGSGFSQETMETIGTMLTERGKMKGSDNAEGSALDSPYLLAAMGVNNDKLELQKLHSWIFSSYNPIVRTLNSAEEASEPVCNYILSPVAMYTSMAAEAAIAASTGGISAILSWAGKAALSEVIKKVLEYTVGEKVKNILAEISKKPPYTRQGSI